MIVVSLGIFLFVSCSQAQDRHPKRHLLLDLKAALDALELADTVVDLNCLRNSLHFWNATVPLFKHFQLETNNSWSKLCQCMWCVYIIWYTHTHVHTRVYIFECMLEFSCQPQHKTGWEHPLIPEAMAAACEGFFSLKLLIAPWSIWSWPVDAIG